MKILIFDDDISTVQMLEDTIDWVRLGFTSIHKAYNIRQAQKIVEIEKNIDVMLCDIEAPGGTGIDLLSWIRDEKYDMECIFLTNHAEFDYAEMAIKLECVDYILKQESTERIEEAVKKAIFKRERKNLLRNHSFLEEYWNQNHFVTTELFWKELLHINKNVKVEKILEIAESRKVVINFSVKYFVLLITFKNYEDSVRSEYYKISENISKIISKDIAGSVVVLVNTGSRNDVAVIFQEKELNSVGVCGVKRRCRAFVDYFNENYDANINCYLGESVYIKEISSMYRKLELIANKYVYDKNKVRDYSVIEINDDKLSLAVTDMSKWEKMLINGESQNAFNEIKDYLMNTVDKSKIDAKFLGMFFHDFQQIVFSALKSEGIQAHKVISDQKSKLLYTNAVLSVYDMLKWTNYIIVIVCNLLKEIKKKKSLLDNVKDYIEENYDKNISRSDLSKKFHINPDYLSRSFNKRFKLSIPEIQALIRIEKAKILLEKGISISETAMMVGYDNLSYFSKVFKKITGQPPRDYQKKETSIYA